MARRGKSKNLSGGLPLPDTVQDTYPTVCLVFQVPDEPEIVRSVIGHIWDLGRWDVWEKGGYGDTRATRVGRLFKSLLLDTLRVRECDDMTACCDNLLSELRQIKALLAAMSRRQALEDVTIIVNEYNSYWNNPTTDITEDYPDAPDVTLESKTGDTAQQAARRVDSLCYLARVLVDTAYEAYRRDKADQSFLANIAIAASSMVLSVAMFFAKRTAWGLILSLMLGLGKVSQDTKDQITQEDLDDEEVKQRVRCKLRSALRTANPNATAIKTAVASMANGTDAREIRMTTAVKEAIANTDDVALQNSIRAALSEAMQPTNIVPPCDCDDENADTFVIANVYKIAINGVVWGDNLADQPYDVQIPNGAVVELWTSTAYAPAALPIVTGCAFIRRDTGFSVTLDPASNNIWYLQRGHWDGATWTENATPYNMYGFPYNAGFSIYAKFTVAW